MRAARIALVAIIAAFEIGCAIAILATYNRPLGGFGYNVGIDGRTVIAVEPGFPAALAGLEPGDVVVFESLPREGRWNAILEVPVEPGTELTFTVRRHGAERTITMRAQPLPELLGAAELSYAVGGLALGMVGLFLVLLRPSKMTWGFALIAPPLVVPEIAVLAHYGGDAMLGYEVVLGILYALQTTGMLWFASRFPTDVPPGINRFIDRLAVPLGVASGAMYLWVDFTVAYGSAPPQHWVLFSTAYALTVLPALAAFVAMCVTYAAEKGSARNRLAPTIATYILWLAVYTVLEFANYLSSNPAPILTLYFLYAISSGLLAAAVAYGVVRHRVIDAKFILSRTLVYSVLTIAIVGVFTLIEYLIGKLLERGDLAFAFEIVAALAIGLSLNVVHVRLDRFIDRVLFRRRHDAEVRLERTAEQMVYASSPELVSDMLVAEPADALDLASAALFRAREDGTFVRERAAGWNDEEAHELHADDHLIVRLRAELKPLDLGGLRWPRPDLPPGERQPLIALPIAIGHSLEAVALYGGHVSGEDLDPDETRSLRGLAASAALAYDHLAAQELRRTVASLRTENAALRAVEKKLDDLLSRHLS